MCTGTLVHYEQTVRQLVQGQGGGCGKCARVHWYTGTRVHWCTMSKQSGNSRSRPQVQLYGGTPVRCEQTVPELAPAALRSEKFKKGDVVNAKQISDRKTKAHVRYHEELADQAVGLGP